MARLVSIDSAVYAARTLKQYCEQNGCMYCIFHYETAGEHFCKLKSVPREYPESATEGGKHYA